MMERVLHWIKKERALALLLLGAFLLRVSGIAYGLPLLVVSDEPPFTLGALKMIQTHTLVPSLHPESFQSILYYPPFGSYLLLVPFVLILLFKYAAFGALSAAFQASIISDLTPFLVVARSVSVILGTLCVYLTYRITESLFLSRRAALLAGFLVATSLLHVALSMVGRNWIMAATIFLIVLYVLTRQNLGFNRRYLLVFVTAGIGMGFHPFSLFALVMAALFYLLFDVKNMRQIIHDVPRMAMYATTFLLLAAVPFFIWHGGNNFTGSITFFLEKSLFSWLTSPWAALSLLVHSEPLLVAVFLGGLVLLTEHFRRIGAFIAAWFVLYITIFYFLFRFDPRFMLPILPVLAIAGGYCIDRLWHRRTTIIICVALLIPLCASVRLAYLATQNDTRAAAREWVLQNLRPEDKVLVFSSSIHIPTTAKAITELREIDPGAMRAINEADEVLDRTDVPHVLNNVTSITDPDFVSRLAEYAKHAGYTYVVVEPRSFQELKALADGIKAYTKDAKVVIEFAGFGTDMSIADSAFERRFYDLFSRKLLGPNILIYHVP